MDYKIIAKSLAYNLTPFLGKFISKEYTGFMKNWNILVNIWQILNIINYTEKENIEALIFYQLILKKKF